MTSREKEYFEQMNRAIEKLCDLNRGKVWAYIKDPASMPPSRIISRLEPKKLILPEGCLLYYDALALSDFPEMRYCSPVFVDQELRPYETL